MTADIEINCQECGNSVKKIKVKSPVKAAAIVAALTIGGSQFVEYAITDNRYPIATEFEILNACINGGERSLSRKYYQGQREVCLCALEDTMNQISSTRKKVTDFLFLEAFRENVKDCK